MASAHGFAEIQRQPRNMRRLPSPIILVALYPSQFIDLVFNRARPAEPFALVAQMLKDFV
jgi:hypothetical protein